MGLTILLDIAITLEGDKRIAFSLALELGCELLCRDLGQRGRTLVYLVHVCVIGLHSKIYNSIIEC